MQIVDGVCASFTLARSNKGSSGSPYFIRLMEFFIMRAELNKNKICDLGQ